MTKQMVKTYSDTYIYKKYPDYEQKIFKYLMSGEIVNKQTDEFQDAMYEIKKRAVSSAYTDCMASDNVVFLHGDIVKPFWVVVAKDLRRRATNEMALNAMLQEAAEPTKVVGGKSASVVKAQAELKKGNGLKKPEVIQEKDFLPFYERPHFSNINEDVEVGAPLKVFINADQFMDAKNRLKQPEICISLLNDAITQLCYYKMPNKLFNYNLMQYASDCFSKLFVHVLDYMAKISVMDNTKNKVDYIATKYFFSNIACTFERGKPSSAFTESVRNKSIRGAQISEREADVIDVNIENEDYANIKSLIEALSEYLKMPSLNIDNFIEKWMYFYGAGASSAFGLEYYPNFSAIITHAYHGCYLNNQKTVEKVCGNSMVSYTKYLNDIFR